MDKGGKRYIVIRITIVLIITILLVQITSPYSFSPLSSQYHPIASNFHIPHSNVDNYSFLPPCPEWKRIAECGKMARHEACAHKLKCRTFEYQRLFDKCFLEKYKECMKTE